MEGSHICISYVGFEIFTVVTMKNAAVYNKLTPDDGTVQCIS
jgi:hypothetical protein